MHGKAASPALDMRNTKETWGYTVPAGFLTESTFFFSVPSERGLTGRPQVLL